MDGPAPDTPYAALMRLLRGRRSIRRYGAAPVDDAVIERLVEAARLAPSAHNRQPWRFASLTDAAAKDALARAMGDWLRADRAADGDDAADIDGDVARSYARITGAAAVIVVCLTMEDMDIYPDAKRGEAERAMAAQSVAMAAQNLLLAAEAEGLAACWMCAPLFCPDTVRGALDFPAGWEPQGMITLGIAAPGQPSRPRGRKSVADILRRGEKK
jgi:coenzyme F420-0:L-glutamate ligase/coenzyme F420-1:gamma-L-glutamate ligase